MRRKIVVVGAGPAGMMAAIRAAGLHQRVTLIEKNPILGKKLLLSGKGRCNLTNACDLDLFLKRFCTNAEFLRDAFKKFFNRGLMDFFEKRGLKLKIERQMRVFPATDSSDSIVETLKKELIKDKVDLRCGRRLKDIAVENNKVKGIFLSNAKFIPADKIILATGGVSYGFTGSTGEGLELAQKLGHRIIPLKPGLVALETKEKYPQQLQGLTLKNIRVSFSGGKRKTGSETGELLFTHFGISGPLVLTLSGRIADWLRDGKKVFASIDLKPALSAEQLDNRLLREVKINPKRSVKNMFKDLLPQKMIAVFLGIAGVSLGKKANQVTKKERQKSVDLFKGLRLEIARCRPLKEAMVTRGGVCLKDISPRTMESRLIKGLYFCGEMIDVDADTGGFNLQAAFSTGYLAGESAALN